MAFLGWWVAWKDQAGINRDDLVDLVKQSGLAGLAEVTGAMDG